HEGGGAAQVVGEWLARGLAVDVERGPTLELEDPRALYAGDREKLGRRAAGLGHADPARARAAQHDPGQRPLADLGPAPDERRIRHGVAGSRAHHTGGARRVAD